MIQPRLGPTVPPVPQPLAPASSNTTPEWQLLTSLYGATLTQDGTPVTSSFTFNPSNGDFDVTWANTTDDTDGYNEADYFNIPLDSMVAGFDPRTHTLEIEIQTVSMTTVGSGATIMWGVIGGAGGSCLGLVNTSAATLTLRLVLSLSAGATGTTAISTAGYYHTVHHAQGDRMVWSASFYNTSNVWSDAIADEGDAMTGSTYYLRIGALKDGVSNANGETAKFRVRWKVVPRGAEPR